MGSRVLGSLLRIWALLQIYAAALWIIGPFGFGAGGLSRTLLPDWLAQPLSYGLQGLTVGPISGVLLTGRQAYAQIGELGLQLSGNGASTTVPGGSAFGDINLSATVQFSVLTTGQGWVWVLIHAVPLLMMAALWWLLADAVARSATSTVFTAANARLITIAGALVGVGSIALSLVVHGFYRWVAHSSQIADRIRVPAYAWHTVPWSAVLAGVTLLVLGEVWRRGVAIEADLGGLV